VPALWLRRLQWPLYAGTVALIGLVLVVGSTVRGSTRWISLPFFDLQPSELGKLLVVVALAGFIADRRDALGSWRLTALALAYVALPIFFVFLQPDLGTATIYAVSALALLFVAGARWTHFAVILSVAAAVAVLVFSVLPAADVHLVKDYQLDRLSAFLHPDENLSGEGWNQWQSKVAIGAGAVTGRGLDATQTTGDFLPEHHTDFIFAVLGESRGFVGAAALLALYLVILWRLLRAISVAATLHGSLIAAGVFGWFLASVFINVGMTIGIAPITGIPLPLVSYGGSGTISALLALGVVHAIQLHGRLPAPARSSR
jgi:rod shape determining protein RodA